MGKYVCLIIGICMLVGYIIYKIYKIIKYPLKVDAHVARYIDVPYENYYLGSADDRSVYSGTGIIPVYEYKYKGMLYRVNNGGISLNKPKKDYSIKVRINPLKPEKAYLNSGVSPVYLFISSIILIIGISIIVSTSNFQYRQLRTSEQFKIISEADGYEVVNVTDQYMEYGSIKEQQVAKKADIEVNFYVFENVKDASKIFDLEVKDKTNSISSMNSERTNIGNYSNYKGTSNDYYIYISRVENTLLCVCVDINQKSDVEDLIYSLGY